MYYKVQIGDELQDDTYDFMFETFEECSEFIKLCMINKHIVKVEFVEQEDD